MIGDVLDSIDLNPIIATLGNDVSNIVGTAVGGLEGTASSVTSGLDKRSFQLQENIIYSTNNYAGSTFQPLPPASIVSRIGFKC